MNWQPIETAPKDGQFIDLWMIDEIMGISYRRTDCSWDGKKWNDYSGTSVEIGPVYATHWMPLPPEPTK